MRSVHESLRGKRLLLTGATGFLGKVFLERVLRSVPEIEHIYILVRAQDVRHSVQRLETDIFSSLLFRKLKEQRGEEFTAFVRSKISFVAGDTSRFQLGLSPGDSLELLAHVDFVVNSAASTDFMERLDGAIETNSFSVRNIVEFVKLSSKARLLHVSTCYVSESDVGVVKEQPKLQPTGAKKSFSWLDETNLDIPATVAFFEKAVGKSKSLGGNPEQIKTRLIELGSQTAKKFGWYNSYTMTKWLGERILIQEGRGVHATIVRPSIIEGSLFEPLPGWIEGLKVADPIFYGFGTGLIDRFPGHKDSVLDLIPVDFVSNSMLLALAELAAQAQPETKIYQVCSGSQNPLFLSRLVPLLAQAFGRTRAPRRSLFPAKLFFAAVTPMALLQRGALWLSRFTRLKSVVGSLEKKCRQTTRFLLLARLYAPYVTIRCRYDNSLLLELQRKAAGEDQLSYPVHAAHIDWEKYICDIHVPGLMNFVIRPSSNASVTSVPEKPRKAL